MCNSVPIYIAALKIFHDFSSQWDPIFEYETLPILNSKVILTERTEYDQITGSQRKERQIIINRQLNLGPAFEYISNYMSEENYREGLRYRVNYQKFDFEDEIDALSAIFVPFDHAYPSLDVREN